MGNAVYIDSNGIEYSLEDWFNGGLEYAQSLSRMEQQERSERLNKNPVGLHIDSQPTGIGYTLPSSDLDTLRSEWLGFVRNHIESELEGVKYVFGTLTFRNFKGESPGIGKVRAAVAGFIPLLDDLYEAWLLVTERGSSNDRLHLHLVARHSIHHSKIGNYTQAMHSLQRSWPAGFSDVSEVRDLVAATKYVCKYIIKDIVRPAGTNDFWLSNVNAKALQLAFSRPDESSHSYRKYPTVLVRK